MFLEDRIRFGNANQTGLLPLLSPFTIFVLSFQSGERYMKIQLLWVGRTAKSYVSEAIDEYAGRIGRYMPFETVQLADVKNAGHLTSSEVRDREGEMILRALRSDDMVVLLDDKGREYTSIEFASWIGGMANRSVRQLVFVIGGAYGFSQGVYDRADALLSISRMTFSHQIVRPIFLEQLYRAMTILRGEPYHHEESLIRRRG